ncbi:TetR/AcrR family transcriptional regulator [Shouchella hunanensis]|uniref:TetR/AcrR family transcriptional regulator n=1 Tax=Shouchella hunanensis TaxID=766894 RepID=A0ABY7WAG6_9BACI|nr:TetR/AcrR family transcriptional regulator [Shouchella hunanensis]WDF05676.1 TetR/AcrR family transcriptional regulator [Shouchella hunanensis]GAF20594.1 transcriptional regulator, TetR family [Bacillus sp. JCM 19047]
MNNDNRSSRRSRPAKDPLSKERIIKEAYLLLTNEGINGLTMRKVAKALDTGASSLYVYVKNSEELCSYVLDYSLSDITFPNNPESKKTWRDNLIAVLLSYHDRLYQHPGVAELAMTTVPLGKNSIVLMEYLLKQLSFSGLKPVTVAWGMDALMMYVVSSSFEHASWKKNDLKSFHSMRESLLSVDASQFPAIFAYKNDLFSGDKAKNERLIWGLKVILNGLFASEKQEKRTI